MKKTAEIIGLPVISISDGMKKGSVNGIIVNADDRTINYIVVGAASQFLESKVIRSDKVVGVGEYALMVGDGSDVITIGDVPAAIALLEKTITVINSKMLTEKGGKAGYVTEIVFDDEDGFRINGVEYRRTDSSQEVEYIPDKCVMTYGKNIVVVFDAYESFVESVKSS